LEGVDVSAEQKKDNILGPIIKSLRNVFDENESPLKQVKNLHDYSLISGILYRAKYSPTGRLWLLCVPESLQVDTIKSVHEDPTGGHLGLAITLYTLKSRFHWPSMMKTIRRFLVGCQICQKYIRRPGKPSGHIQIYEEPSRPFERIGIDFLRPFPVSHRKNAYIFVMIDHLARYTEAAPMTAATGKNAIKALQNHIFYRHSIPEVIVEDQGRQFISKKYQEALKKYGIPCTMTSPYHYYYTCRFIAAYC